MFATDAERERVVDSNPVGYDSERHLRSVVHCVYVCVCVYLLPFLISFRCSRVLVGHCVVKHLSEIPLSELHAFQQKPHHFLYVIIFYIYIYIYLFVEEVLNSCPFVFM